MKASDQVTVNTMLVSGNARIWEQSLSALQRHFDNPLALAPIVICCPTIYFRVVIAPSSSNRCSQSANNRSRNLRVFARFYTGNLFHFSEFIFQTDFTVIQTPIHSPSHGVGHERKNSSSFLRPSCKLPSIFRSSYPTSSLCTLPMTLSPILLTKHKSPSPLTPNATETI